MPVHSFDLAWDEPIRRPVSIEDLATHVAGAHFVGHAVVEGVVLDSREVRPGDLFVALPGAHRNGTDFVTEAIARGARRPGRTSSRRHGRPTRRALRVRRPRSD